MRVRADWRTWLQDAMGDDSCETIAWSVVNQATMRAGAGWTGRGGEEEEGSKRAPEGAREREGEARARADGVWVQG